MLIEYLKMVNFRQFKEETIINFSCDPERNVTVILGNNTCGKTTLLQAFNWCFFNKVELPHKDMLLNYEVGNSMPEGIQSEVSVEIGLQHGGVHYHIKRRRVFQKLNGKVVPQGQYVDMWYKEPDGQSQPILNNQIADKINSILPEKLSSYFFFDTERVLAIGEGEDLSAAVKGLLGLSLLDNIVKHLGKRTNASSVIGQFYKEQAQFTPDASVKKAIDIINDDEEKKRVLNSKIEEHKSDLESYNKRLTQLNQILSQADETQKLQKQRDGYERMLRDRKNELSRKKEDQRKLINKEGASFLLQPLIGKALAFLKKTKVDDKGIKGLTAVTLQEILRRGVCICGQKLEKDSDAYNHILKEIKYVPPASIGTLVRNYKDSLNKYREDNGSLLAELKSNYQQISSIEEDIECYSDEINKLSKQIAEKEDLSRFEEERANVTRRLRELGRLKDDELGKIGSLQHEINERQRYVDAHLNDSTKSRELRVCMAYAENVSEWVQSIYSKRAKKVRDDLLSKVNDIFRKMYTGSRKVELDDKYQVKLFADVNGNYVESSMSEGLRRVKNFAFIAGLVALAKEKVIATTSGVAEEEEVDLSSEPYPLVMDAPFSNVDEKHTANIAKILPEVAEQVIMFVMQKDWNYAKKVMDDKVGARYKLDKVNEVHTELEVIQNV